MLREEVIAALKATGLEAFKHSMSEASKSTEQVGKSSTASAKETEQAATSTKGSGRKIAAGLAVAAGGAVIAKKAFSFMKSAADDATTLSKATIGLSRTTGMDARTASGWVSMTKERGISAQKLQVSLGTMSRRLVAAGTGSKTAAKGFAQLGLDANQLLALPPDLRMGMVADSFKALPDGAQKTALAMQLFGRSGRNMLPILGLGAKGIHNQIEEMQKLGLTVDASGIKKQKELIVQQREMRAAMEGVKVQIGQALIPIMGQLAKSIAPLLVAFNQAITKWPLLVPVITGLVAAFAAMMVIGSVAGAVTAIIPLLPILATGITAVWAAVTGPVGLVVGAIALVVGGFVLLYTKVRWFHNAVNAVWGWIKNNWPLLLGILTGPVGLAVGLIITHFSQVKTTVANVVGAVARFFGSLPGRVAGVGRAVASAILNPLRALPGQALNIGKDIIQAIANGIKSAPGAIIDAIKSVLPGPLKKVVGGVTGLVSKAKFWGLGGIAGAQTGVTTGAGRTTVVGERGPELMTIPAGSRVTPLPPPMLSPSQLIGGGRQPIITQVFLDRKMIATAMGSYAADQQASR